MKKNDAYGVSDIGCVKSANEDHFSIIPPEFPGMPYFLAVSDGVGGRKGGQVASIKALQVIGREIFSNMPQIGQAEAVIRNSFEKANEQLRKLSDKNSNLQGMGTTAVVALVYDFETVICSVGDSRAYSISNNSIIQVTNDHSWTFELYQKGLISQKQMKDHPYRHHLIRALGIENQVNPDVFRIDNALFDWLLLCSDGLTEHVADNEILTIVLKENDPKNAVTKLLAMALARGGSDNITIVLARKAN